MLTLIQPGSSGDIIVYYIIDSLISLVAPFVNGENRVGVKTHLTKNHKAQKDKQIKKMEVTTATWR